MSAFRRMRNHVATILASEGLVARVHKAFYVDDAVAVHAASDLLDDIDPRAARVLRAAGVELEVRGDHHWLLIPVDQSACPPGLSRATRRRMS